MIFAITVTFKSHGVTFNCHAMTFRCPETFKSQCMTFDSHAMTLPGTVTFKSHGVTSVGTLTLKSHGMISDILHDFWVPRDFQKSGRDICGHRAFQKSWCDSR